MSTIRVGSNEKYAEGWDKVFGGKKTKAKTTTKLAAKKASPKKTAKKATKKKAGKKR
ncbi:hypothetical protein [Botrimarina hoheduenensis]|uniref:RNA polymerase subunit sigma n=1 Tax=Botrimarina hoheduenensis TaxID=2528000 RepID=A0A5C5WF01_9BACT|nr:hypothetical protein [Botrimarina hoheduenensis]TWT48332.1 hypothetical protein Pla111_00950 [Botrimarina hoheduenensis]